MNILGIDFEDWFHPELIQKYITDETKHPEVIRGIHDILDLLRKKDTNATFFVVGELLEFKPELLDLILDDDHEIAFHTMKHTRLDTPNFKDTFELELKKFHLLTNVLEKNNYVYDSSVVPAKTSLYGMPNAQKIPYKITSNSLENNSNNGKIIEFPIMVTKLLGKSMPVGGGFYLRTLPFRLIKKSFNQYEKQKTPGVFYIHSWELTPKYMPKLKLSLEDSFITYHNLDSAYTKMEELLSLYEFTSFEKYLKN